MSKMGLIIMILIIMMCLGQSVAVAEPVTLKADEVRYNDETRHLEAYGNVVIEYRNTTIEADQAFADRDLNLLLAVGNVKVTKDDKTYEGGERFLYDFRSERGWLAPINVEINEEDSEEIADQAFITAEEAFIVADDLFFNDSNFTGCNLEHPHYHITASEVEYYPGKRIIFRKAWYWEGKVKLLYIPYLVISLKEDENNFDPPKFGRNDLVGWFLTIGYNYFFDDNNYGKIIMDLTEYGGNGIGVKHHTITSPTTKWYQEYYYLNNDNNRNKSIDEYKYGFGYENSTNEKLKWDTSLENGYLVNNSNEQYLKSTYRFNLYGISPYPRIYFKYYQDDSIKQSYDISENWNYQIDSTWNLYANSRWYYQESTTDSTSFDINLLTQKNWNWSNIDLKLINRRYVSGTYMQTTNYLPEITYTIPKWEWPYLGGVRLTAQYTKLEKLETVNEAIISEDSGTRYAFDLNNTKMIWQQPKLSLNAVSDFRYRVYDYREEITDLIGLSESLVLNNKFNDYLSTNVSLGYTEMLGESISFFGTNDALYPGAFAKNSWLWDSKLIRVDLNTGYNFKLQQKDPISISAVLKPQIIQFNTIYEWGYGFGDTYLRINYNPKPDWRLGLYLGYNFITGWWSNQQFQASIHQRINDKWKVDIESRYDLFQESFSVAQVGVTYDWHCREVIFNYDFVEQKYWLQLSFKAFPRAQFNTAADPSEFFFYE
ncbi:MAG TPA: hypothetical protein PLZ08_04180 [Bacillota bacterium]|nr:hypothetical protein [Bacillota bacterium]HOL09415.1 hypothetical protein [Bacillota bacterium]HPO97139.1 hypothetical protein [Bacillota bacterium]